MGTWIKHKLIKLPYTEPRTGRILKNIRRRKNRPGIDPFESGGKTGYAEIPHGLALLEAREKGLNRMILIDGDFAEIAKLAGKIGKALDKEKALEELKKEMGLPEDTVLDPDGRIILSETRVKGA